MLALEETDGACMSKQMETAEATGGGGGPNHSQFATQPLEDMADDEDASLGVWGRLYPQCGTFPRLDLKTDTFKLGRGSTMDYTISETDMGSAKWMVAVSKCQCEIFRKSDGVFLRDHSSNGTWVNGVKVGKNNCVSLEHDSEISFAAVTKKVYVFLSMDEKREVFPLQLTQKYTVSKVLGRGACGEVRLGFRIPDLHRVAIKVICKRTTSTVSSSSQAIMNEVEILRNVDHPSIINLEDVIDTPDFLFIVLELAEGGELFEKIIEKTKFNEVEAKLHFYQIASAIQYLHLKKICHRDLKPENVLLCTLNEAKPIVKITDMGLSKFVHLGTVLRTFCGTPNYLAPEVIESANSSFGCYTFKVDCWSLGVILYILLSGTPPFSDQRKEPLRKQILTANYVFYPQLFGSVSEAAKDLISKLLKAKPTERLSADEIMEHPWLKDHIVRNKVAQLLGEQQQRQKKEQQLVGSSPACLTVLQPISNQHVNSQQPLVKRCPLIDTTSPAAKRPAVPMEVDTTDSKRTRLETVVEPAN